MPKFYMMIGVPGSGKSTWIARNNKAGIMIASSDAYIDRVAERQGKTYNDVFKNSVKAATQYANQVANQAFDLNLDLIWDQTNTSKKTRAAKLAMVPDHYEKIAVYFPTPSPEELQKRLASREGKHIPDNVIQSMIANLEPPSKNEGFDRIIQP
jgi:predicted kinase